MPEHNIIALYEKTAALMQNEKENYESEINAEERSFREECFYKDIYEEYLEEDFYSLNDEENERVQTIDVVFNVIALCNSFDDLYKDGNALAEELEEKFKRSKLLVDAFFYKNDLKNDIGVESVKVAAFVSAPDEAAAKEKIFIYSLDIKNAFEEYFNTKVLRITIS